MTSARGGPPVGVHVWPTAVLYDGSPRRRAPTRRTSGPASRAACEAVRLARRHSSAAMLRRGLRASRRTGTKPAGHDYGHYALAVWACGLAGLFDAEIFQAELLTKSELRPGDRGVSSRRTARSERVTRGGAADRSPNQSAATQPERGEHVLAVVAPHLGRGGKPVVRCLLRNPPNPHDHPPPS